MSTRRTKPPGAYAGSEDAFQRAAIGLVRTIAATKGIDSRAIMHIPNGGKRNAIVAAKLKAQGTVAGYPDIMVFNPEGLRATSDREGWGDCKVGLALELKIYPRKPSDAQLRIHELLRTAGWRVVVCYSIDQVEEEARRYFDAG